MHFDNSISVRITPICSKIHALCDSSRSIRALIFPNFSCQHYTVGYMLYHRSSTRTNQWWTLVYRSSWYEFDFDTLCKNYPRSIQSLRFLAGYFSKFVHFFSHHQGSDSRGGGIRACPQTAQSSGVSSVRRPLILLKCACDASRSQTGRSPSILLSLYVC